MARYPKHIRQMKEALDKGVISDSKEIDLYNDSLQSFVDALQKILDEYPNADVFWDEDVQYGYYDEYTVRHRMFVRFQRPMTPKELKAAEQNYERTVKAYKKELAENKERKDKERRELEAHNKRVLKSLIEDNPELAKELLDEV